jgi:RHS repeat-associated protein
LSRSGNSGTQPGAGNGTCGSGTLANSLSGAAYNTSYVFTHLGQLWQGPLNGGSTQYQYLYCTSSAPHQLDGLYPLGTTCASKSGQVYTSSYDAFGNVTTRSFSGTTATLSYDILDHFTEWNAGSTNQEWYISDASGQRVLRRSTNSTSTTITVYAFGVEEHTYSGTIQANKYYYTLAGHHLGVLSGSTTYVQLTDALGSLVATISSTATSAAVQGNQVFGPYGKAPYQKGTMYTAKGFTGQYNDSLTGLDYYNARYYDPKVGVFLSADPVLGNGAGKNPYGYVGGNPETKNDPTGLAGCLPDEFCLIGGKPTTLQGCDMDSCSGPPPPHLVFPDLVIPDLVIPALVLASSSSGKAPSGSGGSAQATNSITSCGLSGPSQPLCGNYWVNYAMYLSTGGEIGLPGEWCLFCGEPGGGSQESGETGGFRDLTSDFASDTGDVNGPGNLESSEAEGLDNLSNQEGRRLPVNSRGDPYPTVIDPRTGEPIPFPEGELQIVPKESRVGWNNFTRGQFIREWVDRGYPEPEEGWENVDIHHILPRKYGGTNDFWNLVPVDRVFHEQILTPWWNAFLP